MNKKLKTETLLAQDDTSGHFGAVVPPIFQNSLFTFGSWEEIDEAFNNRLDSFIYTRGKNPTVKIVEEKIAAIATGEKAQLFPSGMAAISAALLHFLKSGDHVIALKNMYGPANNLLKSYLAPKMNLDITYLSGTDVEEYKNTIRPDTRLIYLESPSSAIFSLQDIRGIVELALANNIKTIIDNTWATPIFQKPLLMGVDLEVHSCSKYLGGHSDIITGAVIGRKEDIDSISTREYEWLGAKIAPFEAWLLLRSLRTLTIRMEQHQKNALKVANFLEGHEKISKVYYPGLDSYPQKDLAKKQMSGYSGLLSFSLKTEDLKTIKKFVNSLRLFKIGVSWGGYESLIYAPAISYLKEMNENQFKDTGLSLGDMRISVGLENTEDLIADLEKALS